MNEGEFLDKLRYLLLMMTEVIEQEFSIYDCNIHEALTKEVDKRIRMNKREEKNHVSHI